MLSGIVRRLQLRWLARPLWSMRPRVRDFMLVRMKVFFRLLQITRRQESRDGEGEMSEEWRTMAVIVDRLLFWLTLIVLVAFGIWMSVISARSPQLHADDVLAVLPDD